MNKAQFVEAVADCRQRPAGHPMSGVSWVKA